MEVIQIPLENQIRPLPLLRTRTCFIVHDRLDGTVLRNALDKLIRSYWRKLGARLVTRPKDGQLEYHLPVAFGEDYELFGWSSRTEGRCISEVAPFLQASAPPANEVSFFPSIHSVEHLFKPSDWPIAMKDDPPNSPLLFVHLTFFADATVVTINCPHVTTDQYGLSNIIKAWMGVVENKAPPPMIGYDDDVFAKGKSYADYPKREVVREGKIRVRRRGEYFFVVMGFMSELIFHPKEVSHVLFLPRSLVESLRERHSMTLTEKYGVSPGLSSGDIITAILLKLSRMHDKKSRTMMLSQTVNLRNRVPELAGQKADAYIHNALNYAISRYPIDPSTPVSEIAYQNRQAINETMRPGTIGVNMAVHREMARRGQPLHICEPFNRSYSVTNWTSAWRELNFEPVATEGKQGVKPSMIVIGYSLNSAVGRFSSTVMCRTDEGFWCSFSTSVAAMKLAKEHLAKDPLLEAL